MNPLILQKVNHFYPISGKKFLVASMAMTYKAVGVCFYLVKSMEERGGDPRSRSKVNSKGHFGQDVHYAACVSLLNQFSLGAQYLL